MAELTRLGRYQLKRVLGRGAMGVVYEGLDPSLNRRVAVKTILRNAAIDAETAQHYSAQFAREARAAGRLNHPNIVQVHDFAEEGEVAYLVMEYIQGRELRSFFEAREKFAPAEVVRIMGELLDALDFAHEAGVIHRDVKPANVMLDAQRRVKLADFGVARIQDSERSAAGTMVGTPAFMSPEQIQGLKIDRRTDIFSAGTILYQLLTGEQPFTGQGAWTVAKKIMQDDPPQPSSLVQNVSPVFDAIVRKALAKSPDQRYATAREFAAALRGALAPEQPSALASIPPAAPAARPGAKASDAEIEFWRAIQNSTDAAEFEFYLEQFPDGTYAGLARHKIAKLKGASPAEDTVRLEAEAAAKRRAEEEKVRQEAEARARREAEEKARREAEEKARREAAERAKREAEETARREAAAKARRDAEEKARREAEEKIRQAQALARLKQQEEAAAKAKAPADEDSTVALPPRRSAPAPAAAAPAPEPKSKSMAIPAAIAAVVVIGGVAAYLFTGRTPAPAPAPVAETAPAKPAAAPAAPAVDPEKIRRETEERLRKEFAEKAAAERAALEKSLAEKVAAEAAAAKKVAEARSAAEKAAAEKAAAAAVAARQAAEKAAAEKAAAQQKDAAEKAAAERAAADKAAAEKAAAEKAAAEKASAEKAAADKAMAEKAAAEKAAAEKQVAAAGTQALIDRFAQRVGRDKVLNTEPALSNTTSCYGMPYPCGSLLYINDGSCGSGAIKEITIENPVRNSDRSSRCISLADGRPVAVKPSAPRQATVSPKPAPTAPSASGDADARLARFIQRVGRDKVLAQEPGRYGGGMVSPLGGGEVVYVNDGSCGPGRIKEVTGVTASLGGGFRPLPTRCIPLE
jgi:serine/threonine-protein kinase